MSETIDDLDLRLPKDPSTMTRKERRKWHQENRKRLGLPRWSELQSLQTESKAVMDSTPLYNASHRFVGPWYKRLWSWITSPLIRWGIIRARLSDNNIETYGK